MVGRDSVEPHAAKAGASSFFLGFKSRFRRAHISAPVRFLNNGIPHLVHAPSIDSSLASR